MKKTILVLINGFGVEKKNSYPIYDDSLMPMFVELSRDYLFSNNSVISNVNNIYDAYRNISLDVSELYNYSVVGKDIENKTLATKPMLTTLKQDVENKKGNLHIFCLVDTSMKIVNHLKETLKIINPNQDKKVFLHLIISSANIEDYKKLVEVFSHINMDLANYAQIGFVMGLNAISNNAKDTDLNFFFKMFISKVGEKWQSFTQKFDVLYAMKTLPRDTKPFIVNSTFSLDINDTFMFFNYDNINLTNFINTLSNIKYGDSRNNYSYYSLFEVTSNVSIPYIYEITAAPNNLVSNLNSLNAKALMFCNLDQINIINYYCNGLNNTVTDTITYIDMKQVENNPDSIYAAIEKYDKDLVIVNYNLDDCVTVQEIKNKLQNADNLLKVLNTNRQGSKYTLIVSSLYGLVKNVKTDKETMATVIFSHELPFLYIDDFLTRKNYLIASGNINRIIKSCYKSMNINSNYESLVEKKNGLYKLFFK